MNFILILKSHMKKLQFFKFRDVKSPVRANRKDSGYDMFIPNSIDELFELPNCLFTPKEKISEGEQQELKKTNFDFSKNTIIIPSWYWLLIPSWVKFVLPDTEEEDSTYDMVFHNKSGVAQKTNLVIWASVVDNEYRGEVHIHLINTSNEDIVVEAWQKITQFILRKVYTLPTQEISEEEFLKQSDTDRWTWGFGSSGSK